MLVLLLFTIIKKNEFTLAKSKRFKENMLIKEGYNKNSIYFRPLQELGRQTSMEIREKTNWKKIEFAKTENQKQNKKTKK